jgi:hypothetical protein
MPSWRSAELVKHRDNFTFLPITKGSGTLNGVQNSRSTGMGRTDIPKYQNNNDAHYEYH